MANSMIFIALPWRRYVQTLDLMLWSFAAWLKALKIRALMDKPANIRNMSVIAHGKATYSHLCIRLSTNHTSL